MKILEVFLVFLKLGITSFGGPIAHIGYFHDELVKKRKWIDDHSYADLVALCQFLPGPASSQVGMAIGLSRAGYLGLIAAWIGFTMPSAILLVLFALGLHIFNLQSSWLHGFKIVAVAIVAQALWGMAVKLCPDKERASIAVLSAVLVLVFPSATSQIAVIIISGLLGFFFLKKESELPHIGIESRIRKSHAIISLILFIGLLISLPIIANQNSSDIIKLTDIFYRAGSLVFGGGHVVLPLLQSEMIPNGIVSNEIFLAGYGAAQAVPGPLFTFSAYLGAVSFGSSFSLLNACVSLFAVFIPSMLMIIGFLPFWEDLRKHNKIRFIMNGLNAGVVGLLLAALYNPVFVSAIFNVKDFSLALLCFALLMFWKVSPWIIVLLSTVISAFLL